MSLSGDPAKLRKELGSLSILQYKSHKLKHKLKKGTELACQCSKSIYSM